jgi:hypothetical protein
MSKKLCALTKGLARRLQYRFGTELGFREVSPAKASAKWVWQGRDRLHDRSKAHSELHVRHDMYHGGSLLVEKPDPKDFPPSVGAQQGFILADQ